MRAPLLTLRAVTRAAGFALVAVAIVATTIQLGPDQAAPLLTGTVATPHTDPLMQELTRCKALVTTADQDAPCQAAWAENRRRFFTYGPADSDLLATQTRNQAPPKSEGR